PADPLASERLQAAFHELVQAAGGQLTRRWEASARMTVHEWAIRMAAVIFWKLSPAEVERMTLKELEKHDSNVLGKMIRDWLKAKETARRELKGPEFTAQRIGAFRRWWEGRGERRPEHMADWQRMNAIMGVLVKKVGEAPFGLALDDLLEPCLAALEAQGLSVGPTSVRELLDRLAGLGALSQQAGLYRLALPEPVVAVKFKAVWHITGKIRQALAALNARQPKAEAHVEELLVGYANATRQWLDDTRESRWPVLHAISVLDATEQAGLLEAMKRLEARNGALRAMPLFEDIHLMLEPPPDGWLRHQAPQLVGRTIYYLAAECWGQVAGGLGHVGRAGTTAVRRLIGHDARLRTVEPYYPFMAGPDGEAAIDYTQPPIGIKDFRQIMSYTVRVGENEVPVRVFTGRKELADGTQIDTYFIGDGNSDQASRYARRLYQYNQDGTSSVAEFGVFFSAAADELLRRLDAQDREQFGPAWKSSVRWSNDGQLGLVPLLKLMHPAAQADAEEAIDAFWGHTVYNRIDGDPARDVIRLGHVPPAWQPVFHRYHEADASSAGLRSAEGRVYVSAAHREVMSRLDPNLPSVAIANGDVREESAAVFRNILREQHGPGVDVERPTAEQVAGEKVEARHRLARRLAARGVTIDPRRPLVMTSVRLVPEKAGRPTKDHPQGPFSDDNIWVYLRAGATVLFDGNIQRGSTTSVEMGQELSRFESEIRETMQRIDQLIDVVRTHGAAGDVFQDVQARQALIKAFERLGIPKAPTSHGILRAYRWGTQDVPLLVHMDLGTASGTEQVLDAITPGERSIGALLGTASLEGDRSRRRVRVVDAVTGTVYAEPTIEDMVTGGMSIGVPLTGHLQVLRFELVTEEVTAPEGSAEQRVASGLDALRPGQFIFRSGVGPEEKAEALAAADMVVLGSHQDTEASGASEVNGPVNAAVIVAPPYPEGTLQAQGVVLDRTKPGSGNILIPADHTSNAYREAILWAIEQAKTGRLAPYQAVSVPLSRVFTAELAGAESLRYFNSLVEQRSAERPLDRLERWRQQNQVEAQHFRNPRARLELVHALDRSQEWMRLDTQHQTIHVHRETITNGTVRVVAADLREDQTEGKEWDRLPAGEASIGALLGPAALAGDRRQRRARAVDERHPDQIYWEHSVEELVRDGVGIGVPHDGHLQAFRIELVGPEVGEASPVASAPATTPAVSPVTSGSAAGAETAGVTGVVKAVASAVSLLLAPLVLVAWLCLAALSQARADVPPVPVDRPVPVEFSPEAPRAPPRADSKRFSRLPISTSGQVAKWPSGQDNAFGTHAERATPAANERSPDQPTPVASVPPANDSRTRGSFVGIRGLSDGPSRRPDTVSSASDTGVAAGLVEPIGGVLGGGGAGIGPAALVSAEGLVVTVVILLLSAMRAARNEKLYAAILAQFHGREVTRLEQWTLVRQHLTDGGLTGLVDRLDHLRYFRMGGGLLEESNPTVIIEEIGRLPLSESERALIRLAFLTPHEGGGPPIRTPHHSGFQGRRAPPSAAERAIRAARGQLLTHMSPEQDPFVQMMAPKAIEDVLRGLAKGADAQGLNAAVTTIDNMLGLPSSELQTSREIVEQLVTQLHTPAGPPAVPAVEAAPPQAPAANRPDLATTAPITAHLQLLIEKIQALNANHPAATALSAVNAHGQPVSRTVRAVWAIAHQYRLFEPPSLSSILKALLALAPLTLYGNVPVDWRAWRPVQQWDATTEVTQITHIANPRFVARLGADGRYHLGWRNLITEACYQLLAPTLTRTMLRFTPPLAKDRTPTLHGHVVEDEAAFLQVIPKMFATPPASLRMTVVPAEADRSLANGRTDVDWIAFITAQPPPRRRGEDPAEREVEQARRQVGNEFVDQALELKVALREVPIVAHMIRDLGLDKVRHLLAGDFTLTTEGTREWTRRLLPAVMPLLLPLAAIGGTVNGGSPGSWPALAARLSGPMVGDVDFVVALVLLGLLAVIAWAGLPHGVRDAADWGRRRRERLPRALAAIAGFVAVFYAGMLNATAQSGHWRVALMIAAIIGALAFSTGVVWKVLTSDLHRHGASPVRLKALLPWLLGGALAGGLVWRAYQQQQQDATPPRHTAPIPILAVTLPALMRRKTDSEEAPSRMDHLAPPPIAPRHDPTGKADVLKTLAQQEVARLQATKQLLPAVEEALWREGEPAVIEARALGVDWADVPTVARVLRERGSEWTRRLIEAGRYTASVPGVWLPISSADHDALLAELQRARPGQPVQAFRKEVYRRHPEWRGFFPVLEAWVGGATALTRDDLDEWQELLERSRRAHAFRARAGVRPFGVQVSVKPFVFGQPARAETLVMRLQPDVDEAALIRQEQAEAVLQQGHHPGALAFAYLLLDGDALIVTTLQSDLFRPLDGVPPLPKTLARRYNVWPDVLLTAIEDYARHLGLRRVQIVSADDQLRHAQRFSAIQADRLYRSVPERHGYKEYPVEPERRDGMVVTAVEEAVLPTARAPGGSLARPLHRTSSILFIERPEGPVGGEAPAVGVVEKDAGASASSSPSPSPSAYEHLQGIFREVTNNLWRQHKTPEARDLLISEHGDQPLVLFLQEGRATFLGKENRRKEAIEYLRTTALPKAEELLQRASQGQLSELGDAQSAVAVIQELQAHLLVRLAELLAAEATTESPGAVGIVDQAAFDEAVSVLSNLPPPSERLRQPPHDAGRRRTFSYEIAAARLAGLYQHPRVGRLDDALAVLSPDEGRHVHERLLLRRLNKNPEAPAVICPAIQLQFARVLAQKAEAETEPAVKVRWLERAHARLQGLDRRRPEEGSVVDRVNEALSRLRPSQTLSASEAQQAAAAAAPSLAAEPPVAEPAGTEAVLPPVAAPPAGTPKPEWVVRVERWNGPPPQFPGVRFRVMVSDSLPRVRKVSITVRRPKADSTEPMLVVIARTPDAGWSPFSRTVRGRRFPRDLPDDVVEALMRLAREQSAAPAAEAVEYEGTATLPDAVTRRIGEAVRGAQRMGQDALRDGDPQQMRQAEQQFRQTLEATHDSMVAVGVCLAFAAFYRDWGRDDAARLDDGITLLRQDAQRLLEGLEQQAREQRLAPGEAEILRTLWFQVTRAQAALLGDRFFAQRSHRDFNEAIHLLQGLLPDPSAALLLTRIARWHRAYGLGIGTLSADHGQTLRPEYAGNRNLRVSLAWLLRDSSAEFRRQLPLASAHLSLPDDPATLDPDLEAIPDALRLFQSIRERLHDRDLQHVRWHQVRDGRELAGLGARHFQEGRQEEGRAAFTQAIRLLQDAARLARDEDLALRTSLELGETWLAWFRVDPSHRAECRRQIHGLLDGEIAQRLGRLDARATEPELQKQFRRFRNRRNKLAAGLDQLPAETADAPIPAPPPAASSGTAPSAPQQQTGDDVLPQLGGNPQIRLLAVIGALAAAVAVAADVAWNEGIVSLVVNLLIGPVGLVVLLGIGTVMLARDLMRRMRARDDAGEELPDSDAPQGSSWKPSPTSWKPGREWTGTTYTDGPDTRRRGEWWKDGDAPPAWNTGEDDDPREGGNPLIAL
ncbi:MAG TPA: hypothetical protein DDX89_07275, partial [Candidatus Omnitrophica bacterium]|nr:hypothetical protein [Candidatus Omnitrophota bacterium]